ncbi:hypothetical protein [Microbispora sp. ATCC PTA-5024]|uniref:hypothetical protein n=1 Tax=Microbispora sp. ATCC PTA-5024 TaxID=316330 RepID=UPI0003DC89AE|nr:hypothetical protein [Microbispora sp. ATCC PTA-5024]ETK34472.1 hypothetical protein MPTA5024_19355 [Microbispora sp. ATCC PTA-5024]
MRTLRGATTAVLTVFAVTAAPLTPALGSPAAAASAVTASAFASAFTAPATAAVTAFAAPATAFAAAPSGAGRHPRTVGAHKVRWSSATPVAHGRKVRLTWWSGVAPCTVLDHVSVRETAGKVIVTIWEGAKPSADHAVCPAIAVRKTATVALKKRLGSRRLADGAR